MPVINRIAEYYDEMKGWRAAFTRPSRIGF